MSNSSAGTHPHPDLLVAPPRRVFDTATPSVDQSEKEGEKHVPHNKGVLARIGRRELRIDKHLRAGKKIRIFFGEVGHADC